MPWNFMQVEIDPADTLLRPMVGAGGLTREDAHAEIQGLLDRGVAGGLIPAETALAWRDGAKDDTVYLGPLIWTIYEHPAGEDARKAAMAWLEGMAATMRDAGVEVGIARLP